jgi:hypothetical protein
MFLMMGFTLLMGYGMPKMMANIGIKTYLLSQKYEQSTQIASFFFFLLLLSIFSDPEQLKELREQQQQGGTVTNALMNPGSLDIAETLSNAFSSSSAPPPSSKDTREPKEQKKKK